MTVGRLADAVFRTYGDCLRLSRVELETFDLRDDLGDEPIKQAQALVLYDEHGFAQMYVQPDTFADLCWAAATKEGFK